MDGEMTTDDLGLIRDAEFDDDAYFIYDANNNLIDMQITNNANPDKKNQDFFLTRKSYAARGGTSINNGSMFEESEGNIDSENTFTHTVTKLKAGTDSKQNQYDKKVSADFEYNADDQNKTAFFRPADDKSMLTHALSDQIDKTKVDKSRDLSGMVNHDYFEDHPVERMTDKEGIQYANSQLTQAVQEYKVKIVWSMLKLKRFFVQGVEGETSFKDKGILAKLAFICIDAPFDFIRRLTIPPGSDEQWNRRFAEISQLFAVAFVFYATGIWDFASAPPISFYISEGVALLIAILTFFTTPLNRPPKRAMIFFTVE